MVKDLNCWGAGAPLHDLAYTSRRMVWGRSFVVAIVGIAVPACTLVTNLDGLAGDALVVPEAGADGSAGDAGGPRS